jgi:hypothetical protein
MKYSNFDQVPARALAGAEKDLLSKFVDGTIAFEEFTAYLKAPKSVRKEIAKLLKVYVDETIKDKLMNFGTVARSESIPLYYNTPSGTDPDIVKRLPNATVSTSPAPQGEWKKVDTANGTTESEILETAVKMSLSHAIDTFTDMLTSGVFNNFQAFRIIILEETDTDGNFLRLGCRRRSSGDLDLYLHPVHLGERWKSADVSWLQQQ